MIRIEKPAAVAVAASPFLETDPKELIATAMIELAAQGRTVDAEALAQATELTEAEIETHWRAARDVAHLRRRTGQAA